MANVKPRPAAGRPVPTSNNLALTAEFEPGSVNKVITIAAALQEGIAKPDLVLTVPDHLRVGNHDFTDHDPHPTSQWSVTDILATSSNIGTIELAERLGPQKVDEYLRKFGFGTRTNLGFPHETAGSMLALNDWSGTSIGSIPIGQGVAVTAMQMLAAYNTIANDGRYVAPRLVDRIDRGDGRRSSVGVAVAAGGLADHGTGDASHDGRGGEERHGNGSSCPGLSGGGQDGHGPQTPERAGQPRRVPGSQGRYHYVSTFAGFVPADKPDLSIIVVIDEPITSIFASDVAAPPVLAAGQLLPPAVPHPAALTDRFAGPACRRSARTSSRRRTTTCGRRSAGSAKPQAAPKPNDGAAPTNLTKGPVDRRPTPTPSPTSSRPHAPADLALTSWSSSRCWRLEPRRRSPGPDRPRPGGERRHHVDHVRLSAVRARGAVLLSSAASTPTATITPGRGGRRSA